MKKQWILGTLSIGALAVILVIIGVHGAWADVPAAPAAEPVRAPAATLVVTSTADSSAGTLRWALQTAGTGDTITFDTGVFPPGNPVTIALTSGSLPDITQGNLTIDASDAGVILDGGGLGSGDGFHITSNENVIKGLQILYFPDNGVQIDSGASHNTIGGDTPGERNLISGNGGPGYGDGAGVWIQDNGTMHNTVSGNYIGTDVNGTSALSNTSGVWIGEGASYNTIGGDTPGERNLISGNVFEGVGIGCCGTVSNVVSGNYIGTDAAGISALNTLLGISDEE